MPRRIVRNEAVVHSEEGEDVAHQAGGVIPQIVVEPDPDVLPPKHLEVTLELRVVESPVTLVEDVAPVVAYAVFLLVKRLGEVHERFRTVLDGMQEGGIRPVSRIAQESDCPRLRHVFLYALGDPRGVDVRRRRLADGPLILDPLKERGTRRDSRT